MSHYNKRKSKKTQNPISAASMIGVGLASNNPKSKRNKLIFKDLATLTDLERIKFKQKKRKKTKKCLICWICELVNVNL